MFARCIAPLLLATFVVTLPGSLKAQPPAEDVVDPFLGALQEAEVIAIPSGFGNDPDVALAWRALDERKYIRAREIAEAILRKKPQSVAAHIILGLVHHRGEGNLPIALYHLRRGRDIYEERSSLENEDTWRWHAIGLAELAQVNGEMGRHEDKIRLLLERDDQYSPPLPADRGWPLMRLRRYDEARRVVAEALLLDDPGQTAAALTALCAIEAELQEREAGYQACLEAARHEREEGLGGPTPFTNAAEASLGMLRMDEAERLTLEATERFVPGTVSNPWLDLMHLYLAQGRTSEALDAMRRMRQWRKKQPPFMDEQNRAETEMATAIFLLVAGYPHEASRITTRATDRPDRTGFTSSESEQLEAATALVDQLAHRLKAERLRERASWSSFLDSLEARIAARRTSLRAWSSGRRAAAKMTDERILLATLRPYLAGSVEIPEWIEPELISILGPGVVSAAIKKARASETLPEAEGYFLAYEAEVAYLRGNNREAVELTDATLATLPSHEALLRARVAGLGAHAASRLGQNQRALELYDTAYQLDRGVVRRLGLALPTTFAKTEGPLASQTRRLLEASPRFQESSHGYQITVEGDGLAGRACLLGSQRSRLACAQVKARAGEESEDLARRLAAELHAAAFAPRLDLTQADIRSLDGSPTAGGGRASDRLRSVLSEISADGP